MINPFSYIKKLIYKIKNKRRLAEEAQAKVYGFSVASASVRFAGDRLVLRALLNGIIMFTLVFGLALSFILPFEINANTGMIGFFSLLFALYFSMINCRKGWQSLGYILFFAGFTAFLIIFRSFVNSGLNGMLNDFYETVTDILNFTRMRTYDEAYPEQHYMAVTTFFLVIIAAYMLLINFTFNNEQSPLTLLFIIFPFLQMAMYVDLFAGMPAFFLVTLSVIGVMILRHNFQHHLPVKKKPVYHFRRKKEIYEIQVSSGIVTWQSLGYLAAILLVFSLVISVLLPSEKFRPSKDELALKESTKPTVTKVLMYGLSSLFMTEGDSWLSAQGGQLGQVGTVYQDFETDLEVTFTPYQYETVYFRSNVYDSYWGNNWQSNNLILNYTDYDDLYNPFQYTQTKLYIDSAEDNKILQGKMKVHIVDPYVQGEALIPYYGNIKNANPYASSSLRIDRDIEYVAVQDFWNTDYAKNMDQTEPTALDSLYINTSLALFGSSSNPDIYQFNNDYIALKAVLDDICEEQGFSGTTPEIIKQIQKYLEEDFTYTLNPGKLPDGKDFVTYFLTDTHKGYCTYFASSGCLLLRNLGIPARYCEGYALDMSAVIAGETLTDQDYYDWINGEALVGKTAVIKAPLTDANAHAWVEVYVNGFGWVPVEFTVAGTMDESDKDAWSIWDSIASAGSDDANDILAGLLDADVGAVFTWIGKIIIALIVISIPFLGYKIYRSYLSKKDPNAIRYPANNIKIMKAYQRLVKRIKKKKLTDKENPLPADVYQILIKNNISAENSERICQLYKLAAFSPAELELKLYEEFKALIKNLKI